MAIKIAGIVMDNNKIVGYRLVDLSKILSGQNFCKSCNIPTTIKLIEKVGCTNGKLNGQNLVLTDGRLEDLPVFDATHTYKGNRKLVILTKIKHNGNIIGCYVIDVADSLFFIETKDMNDWKKKYKFYNENCGEVLDTANNTVTVSSIAPPKPVKPVAKSVTPVPVVANNANNRVQASGDFAKGFASGYSAGNKRSTIRGATGKFEVADDIQEVDNEELQNAVKKQEYNTDVSIQDKISRIYIALRSVRPFYYAMLRALNVRATREVATAGVTTKELLWNPDFVSDILESELIFVFIHEAMHIAMQHHARQENRDSYIWNVATDLFINTVICKEFGLDWNSHNEVALNIKDTGMSAYIKAPEGVLYSDKIDIERDTVEGIYEELLKENPQLSEQMSNADGQSQGQSQGQGQGQGQGSQGQSGQGQGQGQQGQGQGQSQQGQGQGGQGQGQSGQGQGQQGQGKGQGNGQGQSQQGQGQQGQGQGNGQGQSVQGGQGNGRGQGNGQGGVSVTFRGENLGDMQVNNTKEYQSNTWSPDIYRKSSDADNGKETEKQEASGVVATAFRYAEMMPESKQAGLGISDFLAQQINLAKNVEKINWKKYFEKLGNEYRYDGTKSISKPNRRYVGSGANLPGLVRKEDDVSHFIFAIDTSGSMSVEELSQVYKHIYNIMTEFNKSDGTIMCWDTKVQATKDFANKREFDKLIKKPEVYGGGGTDINCFFAELLKTFKLNPKNIGAIRALRCPIVIFTDGYFGSVSDEYKGFKYLPILWVIKNNLGFKLPTCFRFEKDNELEARADVIHKHKCKYTKHTVLYVDDNDLKN